MRVEGSELRVEGRTAEQAPPLNRLRARSTTLNTQHSTLNAQRRGLTLVELLVVIIILTTLVSAAIPLLSPTNDDRRLREASRGVNSFISGAQMKAVQTQRPFGVEIKRLSQDTNADPTKTHEDNALSIELYYVEQPAPYRGYDRTSAVCVARHPSQIGLVLLQFVVHGDTNEVPPSLPAGWDADLFPPGLIRPGDVVEVDGTKYVLLYSPGNDNGPQITVVNGFFERIGNRSAIISARPINDTGQMINVDFDDRGRRLRDLGPNPSPPPFAPYWTNPSPYKILRQPTPTSDEPFQLPEGTAIDLRASGEAIEIDGSGSSATARGFFYNPDAAAVSDRVNNDDPIVIMFTPEGAVERVRFNQKNGGSLVPDNVFDGRSVSNLSLLVGRRQNAPPPALNSDNTLKDNFTTLTDQQKQEAKEATNWLRGESRWIVIGAQSGRVVTVENAFVEPATFLPVAGQPLDVIRARQIKASREFAREMVQVGGR